MQHLDSFLKYIQTNFPNLFQGVGSNVVMWILGGVATVGATIWGVLFKKKKDEVKRVRQLHVEEVTEDQDTVTAEMPNVQCSHLLLPEANVNFYERDEYYSRLKTAFGKQSPGSHKQILSGMGGVGKTQIALGFAYSSVKNGLYSDGVFWISGESKDAIRKGFLSIAEELGIADKSAKNIDIKFIVKALKTWFSANKSWLLIVDNAQKDEWLTNFLPNSPLGCILFVTQVKGFGRQPHISVEIFTQEDAKSFIRCRLGDNFGNDKSLDLLVKRLGMFPLAMEQAITYMVRTGMPFVEYLNLLNKHGLKAFDEKDAQLSDYRHVVTTTWRISFAKMKKPATRQLFYLCAYMASENIPIDLFKRQKDLLPYPLKKMIEDERSVGQILSELQSYSLVNYRIGYFNIHGMVQEAMRMQLEQQWKLSLRWKWLLLASRIVARDKHQAEEQDKEEQTNLKERFDWAAQMSTHINAVKQLANRQETSSISIKRVRKNDFDIWVRL